MNFLCWFIDEWRNDLDILNTHKSHPPRSFGLFMFHCCNISKHISISVLFYIISVSCFVFFLLDCFKIIQSRGSVFAQFFCPRGRGFALFVPGGEEFVLSKKVPQGFARGRDGSSIGDWCTGTFL